MTKVADFSIKNTFIIPRIAIRGHGVPRQTGKPYRGKRGSCKTASEIKMRLLGKKDTSIGKICVKPQKFPLNVCVIQKSCTFAEKFV